MDQNMLEENDIVVYKKSDDFVEIGKIKRLTERGAFVWYSLGDTASLTPYDRIMKVDNPYCMSVYLGSGMM